MKYTLTSAEANKLLKKITEERNMLINQEEQTCKFNAALGEEVDSVRPEYNYSLVQFELAKCEYKVRAIKHAINMFNTTTLVGDTGMTIDEILVYIPQLTEKKNKLYMMQRRLPKQRTSVFGMGNNAVIDYTYANYNVETAKKDYMAVSDELSKIQTALDLVNSTVTFDIEIQE